MSHEQTRPGLYDIPDACRRLGDMSPWSMRRHIALGNVPVTRIGRRVFLREETIEKIRLTGLPSLSSTTKPVSGHSANMEEATA